MDWVWPFILGYPQEKIAIINEVCVIHPKKELQPGTKLTIYKEHNPHAELVAVLAKFGYESEVSNVRCCGAALCAFATWARASPILSTHKRACVSLCIALLASLVFMVPQPALVYLYTVSNA